MGKLQKEAEVRYQRSCNHNYLVIKKPVGEKEDYQTGMILENRIPFLLPAECRECEGEEELFYEISSLQPLSRIYEHKELGWAEVREITEGILDAYEKLQDYLLDDAHVVLEPEQIYLDLDDHGISLLFFPYYRGSREESFLTLAEYFLDRIDHRDTSAAMFAYQMYKIVRRENFVPEDIRRALEEAEGAGRREGHPSGAVPEEKPHTEKPFEEKYHTEKLPEEQKVLREQKSCDPGEGREAASERTGRSGLILPILLILGGAAIVFGMIPGIRSGSTRTITGALLILIGAGLLLLSLGRRRPPRNPEPEEIFADLEPSFRRTEEAVDPEPSFRRRGEAVDHELSSRRREEAVNPDPEPDPGRLWDGEDEESYGKTVFIEPEREELRYVLKEKGKAKEYFMKAFPYTIGKVRDCVDLALPDNSVSRIHARIMKTGEGLCLQDCRSTNGTFLNGMRLEAEEKVMIGKGDELGIGKLRFELV